MRRITLGALGVTSATDAYEAREVNQSTAARPRPFTPKLAFPLFVAFLTAFVLLPSPPAAAVDCDAVRCSLQSQFDSQCPCNSFTSHSAYVDCIHNVIVASGFAKDCNSAILNCMANSTCGQGASAVICAEKNGKCDVRQSATRALAPVAGSFPARTAARA